MDVKDSNFISDRSYTNLREQLSLESELPSLKIIKKHEALLNVLEIHSNSKGVFVSIEEKLKNCIQQLYNNGALNGIENNEITIKLCCDGTNISKKTTIYNVSISIINQKLSCKTVFGHYLIGTFEVSEK